MSTNNIISSDLQTLAIDNAIVELFELKLSDTSTLFFHPGKNELIADLQFHPEGNPTNNTSSAANTYVALPMLLEGVSHKSEGSATRPTLTMANVLPLLRTTLQSAGFNFQALIGKTITLRTTFAKYLVGGVDASAPIEFPVKRYIIDRVAEEDSSLVSFELSSPFDLEGVTIPSRSIIGKYCSWEYQGVSRSRGACNWAADSSHSVTVLGNTSNPVVEYNAFFDTQNRPLVSATVLNANSSAYSSGTYARDVLVSHISKFWRSETDSNQTTPSTTQAFWQEVRGWSDYSASATYSANALVRYDNKIWQANVSLSAGNTPDPSLTLWSRIDLCSKTLAGCRCRFQGTRIGLSSSSTGIDVPGSRKSTTQGSIPFGGFPASVKFK